MSDKQQNNVPKKGELIINPKTSRPVKVGSRVWLKLVKDGVVAGHYADPNVIYEVQEGDNEEELIQQFNENLPSNVQGVSGRGKYANKIVKRNKQPSTRATTQHTVRTTARKLKDPEIYEQLQESEDFETELENLIMAELAGITNEPVCLRSGVRKSSYNRSSSKLLADTTSNTNRKKKPQPQATEIYEDRYYTQEPEQLQESEYEEESDDEYY